MVVAEANAMKRIIDEINSIRCWSIRSPVRVSWVAKETIITSMVPRLVNGLRKR